MGIEQEPQNKLAITHSSDGAIKARKEDAAGYFSPQQVRRLEEKARETGTSLEDQVAKYLEPGF